MCPHQSPVGHCMLSKGLYVNWVAVKSLLHLKHLLTLPVEGCCVCVCVCVCVGGDWDATGKLCKLELWMGRGSDTMGNAHLRYSSSIVH